MPFAEDQTISVICGILPWQKHCQLGDYISPIPPIEGNQKQLLMYSQVLMGGSNLHPERLAEPWIHSEYIHQKEGKHQLPNHPLSIF